MVKKGINMRQYLVTEQLLQSVLNALGKARVDLPLADLVALVDAIRDLQPTEGSQSETPSETA